MSYCSPLFFFKKKEKGMAAFSSIKLEECHICLEVDTDAAVCKCGEVGDKPPVCKECASVEEGEWGYCNLCRTVACPACIRACDRCLCLSVCILCISGEKCCNCSLILSHTCAACDVDYKPCDKCKGFMCASCKTIDVCAACTSPSRRKLVRSL